MDSPAEGYPDGLSHPCRPLVVLALQMQKSTSVATASSNPATSDPVAASATAPGRIVELGSRSGVPEGEGGAPQGAATLPPRLRQS